MGGCHISRISGLFKLVFLLVVCQSLLVLHGAVGKTLFVG